MMFADFSFHLRSEALMIRCNSDHREPPKEDISEGVSQDLETQVAENHRPLYPRVAHNQLKVDYKGYLDTSIWFLFEPYIIVHSHTTITNPENSYIGVSRYVPASYPRLPNPGLGHCEDPLYG